MYVSTNTHTHTLALGQDSTRLGCHVQQALSERIDVLGGALNLCLRVALERPAQVGGLWVTCRGVAFCAAPAQWQVEPKSWTTLESLRQVSWQRAFPDLTYPIRNSLVQALQSRVILPAKKPYPPPQKKTTHQPAPCPLPCSSNAAASAAACKSVCVFVLRPSASSIYKFERILLSTPTLPSAQQTAAAAAATAVAVAAASPFRHPAPAVACPCQTVKFMPRRKE